MVGLGASIPDRRVSPSRAWGMWCCQAFRFQGRC